MPRFEDGATLRELVVRIQTGNAVEQKKAAAELCARFEEHVRITTLRFVRTRSFFMKRIVGPDDVQQAAFENLIRVAREKASADFTEEQLHGYFVTAIFNGVRDAIQPRGEDMHLPPDAVRAGDASMADEPESVEKFLEERAARVDPDVLGEMETLAIVPVGHSPEELVERAQRVRLVQTAVRGAALEQRELILAFRVSGLDGGEPESAAGFYARAYELSKEMAARAQRSVMDHLSRIPELAELMGRAVVGKAPADDATAVASLPVLNPFSALLAAVSEYTAVDPITILSVKRPGTANQRARDLFVYLVSLKPKVARYASKQEQRLLAEHDRRAVEMRIVEQLADPQNERHRDIWRVSWRAAQLQEARRAEVGAPRELLRRTITRAELLRAELRGVDEVFALVGEVFGVSNLALHAGRVDPFGYPVRAAVAVLARCLGLSDHAIMAALKLNRPEIVRGHVEAAAREVGGKMKTE